MEITKQKNDHTFITTPQVLLCHGFVQQLNSS